jgi:hypothetical protein
MSRPALDAEARDIGAGGLASFAPWETSPVTDPRTWFVFKNTCGGLAKDFSLPRIL